MPSTSGNRVTRSRAAAAKAADEMNAPPKRAAPAKSVPARRPKADVPDLKTIEDTIAGAATKRPSRATSALAPVVAPARRRIKVTPLDRPPAVEVKTSADTTADKPATKRPKSSSRGNKEPK